MMCRQAFLHAKKIALRQARAFQTFLALFRYAVKARKAQRAPSSGSIARPVRTASSSDRPPPASAGETRGSDGSAASGLTLPSGRQEPFAGTVWFWTPCAAVLGKGVPTAGAPTVPALPGAPGPGIPGDPGGAGEPGAVGPEPGSVEPEPSTGSVPLTIWFGSMPGTVRGTSTCGSCRGRPRPLIKSNIPSFESDFKFVLPIIASKIDHGNRLSLKKNQDYFLLILTFPGSTMIKFPLKSISERGSNALII